MLLHLLNCFAMKHIKLFSMLLTLWLTAPRIFAQQACNVQDSLALIDFYESTNGPDWTNNSGWKQGPVSTWYGVTLKEERVTRLILYDNQLSGSIPASIGKLTKMQILDLFYNQLTDTIPASIGKLTNLIYLYLDINQLNGPIPASMG